MREFICQSLLPRPYSYHRTYTWDHSDDVGVLTRIYLTHDDEVRFEGLKPIGPGWYVDKVS